MSKSGLAGVSMIHIIVFAMVFGAKLSTGVLLPILIIGDLLAVRLVGKEVQWSWVGKLLLPAILGVTAGWFLMARLHENSLRPTVGAIILLLIAIQIARMWRPGWFQHFPHSTWFAWLLGFLAGIATMMANAAGPIIALFLLAISLPKLQLVGTSAWFFLIVNVLKIPFSLNLGLITVDSISLNLLLAPFVLLGLICGRAIIHRIPQKLFDSLLLALTALFALRLIGFW